jgi:hypothetical protein
LLSAIQAKTCFRFQLVTRLDPPAHYLLLFNFYYLRILIEGWGRLQKSWQITGDEVQDRETSLRQGDIIEN